MQDIIIVCAGSVAIDVYSIIKIINRHETESGRNEKYNVIGFLSDEPDVLRDKPFIDKPVIGTIADWKPIGNEKYVLGISSPKSKEKLVNLLKTRGCVFETIIAPDSKIRDNVDIGEGCVISAYSISSGAKIGKFVTIMGSMIGGTAVIGDYSTTLGFANIAASKLEKRVYVGSHAVVLNVTAEDDAFISVGSIVLTNVKAGTKVFGNPAKRVDW